jgi:hypothetical protein
MDGWSRLQRALVSGLGLIIQLKLGVLRMHSAGWMTWSGRRKDWIILGIPSLAQIIFEMGETGSVGMG